MLAGAAWRGYPLLRDNNGTFSNASGSMLRLSYIVRVEGCVGYSSVQRLMLTTAGGSVVQQGGGRCTASFAEEVRSGVQREPTGGGIAEGWRWVSRRHASQQAAAAAACQARSRPYY